MFSSIVDAVSGSNWSYLIVFAVAMIDAFFPIVPSEATAIAAGVVAGAGGLSVELCILAAALGAIAGDNICFAIGHFLGFRVERRFFSGEKSQKRLQWAQRMLEQRGGMLIVVARFIPGGRTATTFTAGLVHLPWLTRFVPYIFIAAIAWASYAALLGYFFGKTFEEEPWKALLLAFWLALSVTAAIEGARYLYHRWAKAKTA